MRHLALAAALALTGCNAIFGIEKPTHADGGAGTGGAGTGGSGGTGGTGGGSASGGGGNGGTLDTKNMVLMPHGNFVLAQTGMKATLTHDFWVDIDEVTVGRFKAWVEAGQKGPCDAACSVDPGGPYEAVMQWSGGWNVYASGTGYADPMVCNVAMSAQNPKPTWDAGNDAFPIVCVSWYQALAFCAFEHKRLPTETEWEYVASQRGSVKPYPWGAAAADCGHAIWSLDQADGNGCNFPLPVGTASLGTTANGIHDLAGSVFEWNWDWPEKAPQMELVDYTGAVDTNNPGAPTKSDRGGSWAASESFLHVDAHDETFITGTFADVGFRCVATK